MANDRKTTYVLDCGRILQISYAKETAMCYTGCKAEAVLFDPFRVGEQRFIPFISGRYPKSVCADNPLVFVHRLISSCWDTIEAAEKKATALRELREQLEEAAMRNGSLPNLNEAS